MTNTERITQQANLPEPAAALGRLAAKCDLDAGNPACTPLEAKRLTDLAAAYRAAQLEALKQIDQIRYDEAHSVNDYAPPAYVLRETHLFDWLTYVLAAALFVLGMAIVLL